MRESFSRLVATLIILAFYNIKSLNKILNNLINIDVIIILKSANFKARFTL